MPPNRAKKRDHSRTHLRSLLSAIMLSTSMITPPEIQETVFLSREMRCPALKEPNAARMAPEAMTPMSLVSLLVRTDGSEDDPTQRSEGHGPYGIGKSELGHGILAESNAHGLRTETGHHYFVHGRSDEGQPRPRDGPTQGNQQGDHRAEHNQRGAERGDDAALDGVPFPRSRFRPIARPVELEFFTENERLNQDHSQLRRPHIARL